MQQIQTRLTFLRNALFDRKVGAVTMSSKYVVLQVLKHLPKKLDLIIEYGPGSGVLTRALLTVLSSNGRLVVFEQNKYFVDELRTIKDHRLHIINTGVEDISTQELQQFVGADAFIASIPFSFLAPKERLKIVADAHTLLISGGSFIIAHQYSLLMRELCVQRFRSVSTKFELRNIFPCFVIGATK